MTQRVKLNALNSALPWYLPMPFTDNFPLDWLRKQLLVCMGLVAEETRDFINGVNNKDAGAEKNFDWKTAKKVASVAGSFLRAFFEK